MAASRRSDGCLSDFAIDRWLAGELSAAEAAVVEEHAAHCERCRQRVTAIRGDKEAFAREAPSLLLSRSRGFTRRRAWLWSSSGLVAAAAALVMLIRPGERAPGTRVKGAGAELGFYVRHAGAVRLGAAGERLEPGDVLRFVVTLREPRYVAVLSLDGARRASIYYASPPEAPVAAGVATALPASIELDATLGDETLYGVFCASAFDAERLRQALEGDPGRPPAPGGCDVDAIHVQKEAAPTP